MAEIIRADGLVKRYGEVVALDGLDLSVQEGTIVALLGPNGAGKTTAVSILTTLIEPNEGSASVAGIDVLKQPAEVRKIIGLSGQYAAVDKDLTGFENLDMIGRLYHLGRKKSRSRARELLERFDLSEAGDRPVKTYSGGMRRRLDLAGALVAESPVLFLDEPTTGLDLISRTELWRLIRNLIDQGNTLLLTTQYLEEADRLADDVLVIDYGKTIAQGSTDELKDMVGGERIEIKVTDSAHLPAASEMLGRIAVGDLTGDDRPRTVVAPVSDGVKQLAELLKNFEAAGIGVSEAVLRRPTLDDVFLALTGASTESREVEEPQLALESGRRGRGRGLPS
ncbi:MAG: ATP-binding cassette domain-containing protein [Acidimicrobiia bacterium]|nr:ATP-binding cassette domain-containing protein [bacterium]MXX64097.1 ATP-binding cassette domain-containing protein [Acidimicrobiia bacterium]MCY3580374.1 ATP-binding cassette domain-containing protein [bacterium]MCY3653162.1 ATP-binding cassette domain-containing protein [bacterium]MDE0644304.1 ATP-binding cassette domain-containing protein [bacterium]